MNTYNRPTRILLLDADPVSNLIVRRQLQRYPERIELCVYEDPDHFVTLPDSEIAEADLLLIDMHFAQDHVRNILERVKASGLRTGVVLLSSFVGPHVLAEVAGYEDIQLLVEKPLTQTKLRGILKNSLN